MAEEEVSLDLEELRQLQSLAKRPRILTLISSEIRDLEHKIQRVFHTFASEIIRVDEPPKQTLAPVKVHFNPAGHYVTLSSFSWEQDNDKVKLYISLEGIDQEKLEVEFKSSSFDVKFHDVGGKNYRCAIPRLNKKIAPEKCKVFVKPSRAVITLVKASKGNWLDLHFKEDKLKQSLDKEKDPMAGIMDLMKNMYEEGDEDMKRTIAKAWSDARSGKTGDPMKGFN